jgi:hypothetical protein
MDTRRSYYLQWIGASAQEPQASNDLDKLLGGRLAMACRRGPVFSYETQNLRKINF